MKASSRKWLMFWRVSFFALVLLWLLDVGYWLDQSSVDAINDLGFWVWPVLIIDRIFMLIPFVAHFGHAFQMRFGTRAIWRVVFVIFASLQGCSLVIDFIFLSAREIAESLLWLVQLAAVWCYAYRSDHLWPELCGTGQPVAEGGP
jgi:hypothetical protein